VITKSQEKMKKDIRLTYQQPQTTSIQMGGDNSILSVSQTPTSTEDYLFKPLPWEEGII